MQRATFLLFLVLIASPLSAATFNSDGSQANVQALHDATACHDGDTITLPAGTFTWANHVNISKDITIQGLTTTNSDTGICDDKTILAENGNQGFFRCFPNERALMRITGITFTGLGQSQHSGDSAISFAGASHKARIDHCHFTGALNELKYIATYGPVYGVADHIVLDNTPGDSGQHKIYNGTGYGDLEWSRPAGYGGPDFFFFEDWYINNPLDIRSVSGGADGNYGGKFVYRHCHLFNVEILCHGTEQGRSRGGRAQELYSNDYHFSHPVTLDGIRSGGLIVHDNTFFGAKPSGWGLQTYRTFFNYGAQWLAADGRNNWDVNVTESDGVTHVDGHQPFLFESGTLTATGGPNCCPWTVTDASKNWTTDRWSGYSLRRTSDGATCKINGNTNNTLHLFQWMFQDFQPGQAYEIRKVLQAIDQPGLGQGDLLTGDNPTPRWLNQVREGCWSWNNIYTPSGSHINFTIEYNAGAHGNLEEGLDYFSDTPLPGYTPYVYPHPLVSGASPTPTATPGSSPTPTATATATPDEQPVAPTELTAKGVGKTQIVVRWLNNDPDADSVYLERSKQRTGPFVLINIVSPSTTRLSDFQLSQQTAYFYRARVYTPAGFSAYSDVAVGATFR